LGCCPGGQSGNRRNNSADLLTAGAVSRENGVNGERWEVVGYEWATLPADVGALGVTGDNRVMPVASGIRMGNIPLQR
jgi:hypothetical protein